MLTNFQKVQHISFSEHPVIDIAHTDPGEFDISSKGLDIPSSFIINREFIHHDYCQALLHKICTMPQCNLSSFIDYQCSKVTGPTSWLNELETLLENNIELLESNTTRYRLSNLFSIILDRRNLHDPNIRIRYNVSQPATSILEEPDLKFDFKPIKAHILKLESYEAKYAYMIEIKAVFEQIMKQEKLIGSLIDIELDKLDKIENIKKRTEYNNSDKSKPRTTTKIRINCKLNVFVDVFYQLMHDLKINGLPLIECPSQCLAEFIERYCVDSKGNPFSRTSVETILSPSREDKRPKGNKKVDVKKLIDADQY